MEDYKDEEWLREQYVERGRSTNNIAEDFDISHATISHHLHANGIRTGMYDRYKYICPGCNIPYKSPSHHFTQSDCQRPKISDVQEEMLKGLVMGDGSIHEKSKNWSIQWASINREFMEWFDWRMGDLGIEVREERRKLEEIRKSWCENYDFSKDEVDNNTFHRIHHWKTISHPLINKIFSGWIEGNQKRFPKDINISPICLCIWYCGDGGLTWNRDGCISARITTVNESDNISNIVNSLESVGLTPSIYQHERTGKFDGKTHTYTSISFSGERMNEFFNYIGEAPPGMEYKWETESRQRYNELLKNSKTKIEPALKDSVFDY